MVDADDPTKGCGVDPTTGLPSNCVFEIYPYRTGRASLMYSDHLPSVGIPYFLVIDNRIVSRGEC